MPAAVLAAPWFGAAITGAATVGGTYMQVRGQGNAQKAQLKANDEAMQYERQRQSDERARLARYNEEYKRSYLDWYGRVGDEGLKRFGAPPVGVRLPGAGQSQGPAVRMEGSSVAAPMAAAPMAPAAAAPLGGAAPLTQAPQAGIQPQGQPQQASLGGWEDWNRYPIGA